MRPAAANRRYLADKKTTDLSVYVGRTQVRLCNRHKILKNVDIFKVLDFGRTVWREGWSGVNTTVVPGEKPRQPV